MEHAGARAPGVRSAGNFDMAARSLLMASAQLSSPKLTAEGDIGRFGGPAQA